MDGNRNIVKGTGFARLSAKGKAMKRVSSVLNNVVNKLGLDRRLREHTLMALWPALAGHSWAKRSRPVFIDADGKLVVAVADASTGQELSLMKSELFKKVSAAARSVGVEISGLRFDLKNYYVKDTSFDPRRVASGLAQPTADDLAAVELPAEDLQELASLKVALNERKDSQLIPAERIISVFEHELRLRRWMRQSDYPICQSCKHPARSLYGQPGLCLSCFWSTFNCANPPS